MHDTQRDGNVGIFRFLKYEAQHGLANAAALIVRRDLKLMHVPLCNRAADFEKPNVFVVRANNLCVFEVRPDALVMSLIVSRHTGLLQMIGHRSLAQSQEERLVGGGCRP
ncbi:hypothetical protein WS76_24685 [Burkholderia humptydooensis]|nr:hypothetical protein WS76_24685 [Burkholderia humptydooensis]